MLIGFAPGFDDDFPHLLSRVASALGAAYRLSRMVTDLSGVFLKGVQLTQIRKEVPLVGGVMLTSCQSGVQLRTNEACWTGEQTNCTKRTRT